VALVVGIGNRGRGDDAVGPVVADRVAALGLPGVRVVVDGEPLHLVELLAGHDEVVVVDAVRPGRSPGRLRVHTVGEAPLRHGSTLGSHGLGVAEAVELARALGRLPGGLTLVGVEAATLSEGAPLSAPVRGAVDDAVRAVLGSLAGAIPLVP